MKAKLTGAAASPGLGWGRAALWRPGGPPAGEQAAAGGASGSAHPSIPAGPASDATAHAAALARFQTAVAQVEAQLQQLEAAVAHRAGGEAAAILGAQAMMARDPELAAEVSRRVAAGTPLPRAVEEAGAALAELLAALDDPYLQQRAADVRDVTGRIVAVLTGASEVPPAPYPETILVAPELPPSAVAHLDPSRIKAVVTAGGGPTAHAALLAKGLGIPAVMGCGEEALAVIAEGDWLAVDGSAGTVLVAPDADETAQFQAQLARAAERAAALVQLRDLPAVTHYGRPVMLAANLAGVRETPAALENGAEGVGLFRTEFLFMDRNDLPGEEEQFQEYKAVLEAMAPRPVVIRTLDIGGDKPLPALPLPAEENPFLGWRGVRLWLEREDLAIPQIRALLRAAPYGDLHVMVPMVADLEELRRVRALFNRVQQELGPAAGPYKLGIMIEVPAAALAAEALAQEADFFSIGTNDLVQYTLAADRGNPRVAYLYNPLHPAVLRLIAMTVAAAHARGIPVAVCGDAAGDPQVIPALVALGVDELSMPPAAIPVAKELIRDLSADAARRALAGVPGVSPVLQSPAG